MWDRPKCTAVLSLLLAVALLGSDALAITRRHDRTDEQYLALGAEYPEIGITGIGDSAFGSGVLISPGWVLSVAHVVNRVRNRLDEGPNVAFAASADVATPENTYHVSAALVHPDWGGSTTGPEGFDIGLMRLSRQVLDVTPAVRYTGSDEVGKLGIWVGFGRTGDGNTGAVISDQTRRGAENMIDALGRRVDVSWSYDILVADFDNPGFPNPVNHLGIALPVDLEGAVAAGDSGGGLFAEIGGVTYLLGLHSFVVSYEDGKQGIYDDLSAATRVSSRNDWIDEQLLANADTIQWNNPAGGSFNEPANWNGTLLDQAVPNSVDSARLTDLGAETTITFPGNIITGRLLVDSGLSTFDLQSFTYTLAEIGPQPAAQIDDQLGGSARLTLRNGTLDAGDGTVEIGLSGNGQLALESATILADQFTLGAGATLLADVAGGPAFVQADAVTLAAGNTLGLTAGQSFPSIGHKTQTVVDSADVTGIFTNEPDAGEHLGHGVFHEEVDYGADAVEVKVFQAVAGDANGDRRFKFDDLVTMFSESGAFYGDTEVTDRDWTGGDFTGEGGFTFADLVLAFGQAGQYYGESEPYVSTQQQAAGDTLLTMLSESDLRAEPAVSEPLASGGHIQDVSLTVHAIPEPGTLVMLAAGLFAALLWRWRRAA